ncbi:MAG: DUF3526 domain-containing protein [Pseudomonadota bacterium]
MNASLLIARDEWRYWRRSKLGKLACAVVGLLIVASLVSTFTRIEVEKHKREHFQANATEQFERQPARHPHRMVHYGHYVFRVPVPLSLIDPGVDAHAGTVMFLEGHRQNSAVFAPRYTEAQVGSFADLSPAFVYQVLVPLLLIVLGFSGIPREREAKTDYLLFAAAVRPQAMWFGKSLALAGAAGVALLPLVVGLGIAAFAGEHMSMIGYMLFGYALYLLVWVFLVIAVAAWSSLASTSLTALLAVWILTCVVMPPLVASSAKTLEPAVGKIATDLAVARALRDAGDGHNANDPAFARLRAQLLEQYGVDDVENLPINFRGVVAEYAEAKQTQVLNALADEAMTRELAQSELVRALSFLSPTLALKNFSMIVAGTDLRQQHNFQRDAERVRFGFVQSLNKVHAQQLTYADDMQRSNDAGAERRTRVSNANWRMLETVSVEAGPPGARMSQSLYAATILLLWAGLMALLGWIKMQRDVHGGR